MTRCDCEALIVVADAKANLSFLKESNNCCVIHLWILQIRGLLRRSLSSRLCSCTGNKLRLRLLDVSAIVLHKLHLAGDEG